ncbi:MAG: adaptor protein MecA [Lachnospiraceae bacterium]|nr:adaptor protein MecA [Lachnospiraceae bacterium]
MIIVRMNNTAVECSIAASELQEMGLTPEGIGAGDVRSSAFMNQLNREIGAQLGFDPKTDILMMSKNMMNDGSLRVFVMKMSNEDIQAACDRIRSAAEGVLKHVTQDRIDELKASEGNEKGRVLGEIMSAVMNELASVVTDPGFPGLTRDPEVVSRPAVQYARYMARLSDMHTCIRLSRLLNDLPVVDSALFRQGSDYYLTLGVNSGDEREIFDLRRMILDYSEELTINSPEELHITENAEPVIAENAVSVLAKL